MVSILRLIALVATLGVAGAVTASGAAACSCALVDPVERLANGDPALIGEVTARRPLDPPKDLPPDAVYEYDVRVERELNVDLPETVTLSSYTNGAACGFEWDVGQRVGAFLYSSDDGWATNLCMLVAPAKLQAAAAVNDPRLRLRASWRGRAVRAGVGPVALTTATASRFVDYPPPILRRLPVRPRARVKLRLGAPAESVVFSLAPARGVKFGRDRRARRADGRTWFARLPRRIPRRFDRLAVHVELSDGSSVNFGVGIKPARRAAGGRASRTRCPR